jgi:hypothetical protein
MPLETKMGVCTDLLPDEYCGYHPMERNNPNGFKKRGLSSFDLPRVDRLTQHRPVRGIQLELQRGKRSGPPGLSNPRG